MAKLNNLTKIGENPRNVICWLMDIVVGSWGTPGEIFGENFFFSIFSGVWNFYFQSAVTQSWLVWHTWSQEIFYGVVHPLYFEKKIFWKFLKFFFKTVDFVFFTHACYMYQCGLKFSKKNFMIIKFRLEQHFLSKNWKGVFHQDVTACKKRFFKRTR